LNNHRQPKSHPFEDFLKDATKDLAGEKLKYVTQILENENQYLTLARTNFYNTNNKPGEFFDNILKLTTKIALKLELDKIIGVTPLRRAVDRVHFKYTTLVQEASSSKFKTLLLDNTNDSTLDTTCDNILQELYLTSLNDIQSIALSTTHPSPDPRVFRRSHHVKPSEFITQLKESSHLIGEYTNDAKGNVVIMSSDVYDRVGALFMCYNASYTKTDAFRLRAEFNGIKIYVINSEHYPQLSKLTNYCVMTYRGETEELSPYKYCPYNLVMNAGTIMNPDTGQVGYALMTRGANVILLPSTTSAYDSYKYFQSIKLLD
jgi:hypothetical protein